MAGEATANEGRDEAVERLGERTVAVMDWLWGVQFTPNYCDCNGIEYQPCDECRAERIAIAAVELAELGKPIGTEK